MENVTREVLEALKKYKKGDMIDFNGFETKRVKPRRRKDIIPVR